MIVSVLIRFQVQQHRMNYALNGSNLYASLVHEIH